SVNYKRKVNLMYIVKNIEIILYDFEKIDLPNLIYKEFNLLNKKIVSSHFYDSMGKDVSFSEVKDIKQILSPRGTGNLVLNELELGVPVEDIVLVLSFDEKVGDIVLNFLEQFLLPTKRTHDKGNVKEVANDLMELQSTYSMSKAIIGYGPATDEDSRLIEITDDIK